MATLVAETSAKEKTRPVLVRGTNKAYRVATPSGELVVGPITPQDDHLLGYAYLRFKEDGLLGLDQVQLDGQDTQLAGGEVCRDNVSVSVHAAGLLH